MEKKGNILVYSQHRAESGVRQISSSPAQKHGELYEICTEREKLYVQIGAKGCGRRAN